VNNRFFIIPALLSIYAVFLCLATSAHAKTYRWVDDAGHVHYSDQLPSNDVDRAYSIMNKGGVTIDKVDKAKSKAELEEESRREKIQAEQQNYDHVLLDTYSKVSDLEDTRDRYIASIEGLIKVSQHKLANLKSELDKLNKTAANLERSGKAIPEELHQDMANIQSQIDRENDFIHAQRAQQQETREKFASDIKRFQELKSQQQLAK